MTALSREDRGSALPALLALVVAGLLLAGVAIDLGRWGSTWRAVADAAAAAARAAAGQIDETGVYLGVRELDRERALEAAWRLGHAGGTGRTVAVDLEPAAVCVTVTDTHHPTWLRAVGVRSALVSVTACASPAQG